MHMRRRAVALHTLACAALIALSLTDGWTAISTLHGQAHDCFALFETTHADDAATPAKMSLLAARVRLDDLVIGSLSAASRRSTESWLYLYDMTCGATHVSNVRV